MRKLARMNKTSIASPSIRGPADHEIRNQIVVAANQHFSQYGYSKTTVSDLAKAIGFSKAYLQFTDTGQDGHRFFGGRQRVSITGR